MQQFAVQDGSKSVPGPFQTDWAASFAVHVIFVSLSLVLSRGDQLPVTWLAWFELKQQLGDTANWILGFCCETTDSTSLLFAWILLSAPIWKLQFSCLFEPCLVPNYCTSLLAFFLRHQPYGRPKWVYRYNTGEPFLEASFTLKRLISLGALYGPWRET